MNPEELFCLNLSCPARGQIGKGNIGVHSEKEERCICHECGETFAATKGTIFHRLRTDPETVMLVIVLLSYQCPIPAIVKAFGYDERTVKSWWNRAGVHCEGLHEHIVGRSKLELIQIQADEIRVKVWGGVVWMAMCIAVPSRLWLAGVVSPKRDRSLIQTLADQVRNCSLCRPVLIAVDGLASYPGAFKRAFRSKARREPGQRGRSRLVEWPDIQIVQVVKKRTHDSFDVCRRIYQGSQAVVERLIFNSQGGGVINTAYIERINATFRQRIPWLTRRSRYLAHDIAVLQSSMFIVGCFYNFHDFHHSLRLPIWISETKKRWVHRTPAMAAGLTDHPWSISEIFAFRIPPEPWTPPLQRGRPSKQTQSLVDRWCQ